MRGSGQVVTYDCVVRDVSPEGIGLGVSGSIATTVRRGDKLTVRFTAGSHNLEIPGKVIYADREHFPDVRVGVRLLLELAGHAMRQSYASWIVVLLSALCPPSPGTPTRR